MSKKNRGKVSADNWSNHALGRAGKPFGSMLESTRPKAGVRKAYNIDVRAAKQVDADNYKSQKPVRVSQPIGSRSESATDKASRVRSNHNSDSPVKVSLQPEGNTESDREGLPSGTVSDSKRIANEKGSGGKSRKVYKDTPQNRKLVLAGMPLGTAVISKEEAHSETGPEIKVYKDTPQNRRLKRVGKPKGSMVFSEVSKSIEMQVYQDSSLNRRLKRVGLLRGSKPNRKKSPTTKRIPELLQRLQNNEEITESGLSEQPSRKEALEQARFQHNRLLEERSWNKLFHEPPKTERSILENYVGKKIPLSELKLHRPIGRGGFGSVYFAKWKESVVAVKRLDAENNSERKLEAFVKEVMMFCKLNHENIVKFVGACVEIPNICIVMEYMQMSLFDLLHVRKDIEIFGEEKLDIIKQICQGMKYLHSKRIAHCDLKPPNILLDYIQDEVCDIKLTDFGLSMIKDEALASTTNSQELVRNIGTPRYSAPEVLRGDSLSAKDMMMADVYSLGLICFEVMFEEEPFAELNRDQLKEQVGQQGKLMSMPNEKIVDDIRNIIERSWSYKPGHRPKMADVCDTFEGCKNIFLEQLSESSNVLS